MMRGRSRGAKQARRQCGPQWSSNEGESARTVRVADRVGDVEDEGEHDNGEERNVELEEADEQEEDPRRREL